jgi:hypothetical protein
MDPTGDDLTTVATFANTAEAELSRERLVNEGIEAFVIDGGAAGVMPFMGATMGGIHLQVRNSDLVKAKEVLGS